MSDEDMHEAIERVLQRYAELQLNLVSPSARTQLATAIVGEIRGTGPGIMNLSELVSLPPNSSVR